MEGSRRQAGADHRLGNGDPGLDVWRLKAAHQNWVNAGLSGSFEGVDRVEPHCQRELEESEAGHKWFRIR